MKSSTTTSAFPNYAAGAVMLWYTQSTSGFAVRGYHHKFYYPWNIHRFPTMLTWLGRCSPAFVIRLAEPIKGSGLQRRIYRQVVSLLPEQYPCITYSETFEVGNWEGDYGDMKGDIFAVAWLSALVPK